MMGSCFDRGRMRMGSDADEAFSDAASVARLCTEMDTVRRLLDAFIPELRDGGAAAQVFHVSPL